MRSLAGLVALSLILSGCSSDVLEPSGYVATEIRDVLGATTFLIALIVVPVMITIVIFAFRYRKSANNPDYDPSFSHSSSLELLIWSAPLLIIICLGAMTWVSTHKLDPYRPLDSDATGVVAGAKPLEIQVVSMDWKWLFIYPEYGVASVNEFAAPVDRPISFKLTSTNVMNAFYVPALAGMIYTMPSMETQLHAVINRPGVFPGRSTNYSGAGFSGMAFNFHGLDQSGFDKWIGQLKAGGKPLDRNRYIVLESPSENNPVTHFSTVDRTLYHDIVNRCVLPGEKCIDAMRARHSRTADGKAGQAAMQMHHAAAPTEPEANETIHDSVH